ncbi:hypothetical protein ACFOMD_13540 [Sphingoaurantiacus capsulatus]|uniref:Uncharacterized protein n=1 Tax=Sphingoaurantiacus capsulatus TaxID=1771310 RepID=A0ABV7XD00_9SPHN
MRTEDISATALTTSVSLLDALLDSAAAALPGVTAALYARDLRTLGDGAAIVAADLESTLKPVRTRRRRAA